MNEYIERLGIIRGKNGLREIFMFESINGPLFMG
jgi:hypothetical protein